jgi:UDP-glucose 4-epimerase
MNVLVTGGTGYIGSHTCVELLGAGQNPAIDALIVVDNFCNSKPDVVDAIQKITGRSFVFIRADIRDREAMRNIFANHPIDAVIHFAALKAVGESVSMPLEYYSNNLIGSIVLLETMKEFGVRRMVFSSSATVYGMHNPVPFLEEYGTSATNPYGYSKVVIERLLMDLADSDPAWAICLLRYFNPIGAHESSLIGEDPNDIPNNLLPYISQVAAGKLSKVTIHGDDYDTPDGTGVRDYIHVVDLAKGHLSALSYILNHKGAHAINLGTGRGTSVLEVIHAYEKACGRAIPYEIGPRRAGDIGECYASVEKAEKVLGWTAKKTIEDMCADGWRFAKGRYSEQNRPLA